MNLTLNKTQSNKFFDNAVLFMAPLGVLYLTTIIGVISQPNHLFTLDDLIPNQVALGGMVLWLLNSLLDYVRKLQK